MNRREMIAATGASISGAAIAAASPVRIGTELPAQARTDLERLALAERLVGVAIAVAKRGKLIGEWRFGKASLQFAVPVAKNTLFAVASVAKHVTATGVLRLVDMGVIRLDEPIRTYLPILPAEWGDRSVRALLTHTSGLPDFTLAPKPWAGGDDPTRQQLIERMHFRKPLFRAGEGWSYCNSNYLFLGWLIEDHLGKPFSEALREWVLRPAGTPLARADGPGIVTANLAEPYIFDEKYWRIPFPQTDLAEGAGSLQWSVNDIAPWGDALLSNRLLSSRSQAESVRWHRNQSGLQLPYGFGFFLDAVAGQQVHWHNGGAPGTVGMFLQLPNENLTVAVMCNTDTPGRTMRRMGWRAAHAFAPHATYLDRAALAQDSLDARLASLCAVPGPLQPDPTLISADFLHVLQDQTERRRFNPGFGRSTRLEKIEEYKVGRGTMRRYRVIDGAKVDYKLAGFDEDGRLFWLWGC